MTDVDWGFSFNKEQVFTSPGTWTCPPTTTSVFVVTIAGGGSGQWYSDFPFSPVPGTGGGGGGGGLRYEVVPVSGPVPVTVGAGGTIGAYPSPAGVGGTTSFGPISVEGGGGGQTPAPANGGGGGQTGVKPYSNSPTTGAGVYGTRGTPYGGGGAFDGTYIARIAPGPATQERYAIGWQGHARGAWEQNTFPGYGAGGGGGRTNDPNPASNVNATPGSAGAVIVRWNE